VKPPAEKQAARDLAALQARYAGRWDIWAVETLTGPTWWCARPAGTQTAVHEETESRHLAAWLDRVNALTDAGVTIAFRASLTVTATWTGPGSTGPDYGPAPVPDVLDHAERALAARRAQCDVNHAAVGAEDGRTPPTRADVPVATLWPSMDGR